MKVGIDSYCYHRQFGEVYPGQTAADGCQGFRTIQATEAAHARGAHGWPPGHIMGCEHSFVHAAVEYGNGNTISPPTRPAAESGSSPKQAGAAERGAAPAGLRRPKGTAVRGEAAPIS